jgi:dTDP-4-dehydrorhamnose reductase
MKMKQKVLILGASGMLGSMLVDCLSRSDRFEITGAARSASGLLDRFREIYSDVVWRDFTYDLDQRTRAFESLGEFDWIINAIGITKPLIKDDNPSQIENAVLVNCILPHDLGRYAMQTGAKVLQIATDCVYSGAKGFYVESDAHDALDVYGKTKSIGESWQPSVHNLRCSIIGPEPKDFKFLIEWFRRQPERSAVNGFTNHSWNGVTTLHFARFCEGIMNSNITLDHVQHVVPRGTVTKAQMLRDFAKAYGREDIVINDVQAKSIVDRTLATQFPERNAEIWSAAGYKTPPTVSEMIAELGSYEYRGAPVAA